MKGLRRWCEVEKVGSIKDGMLDFGGEGCDEGEAVGLGVWQWVLEEVVLAAPNTANLLSATPNQVVGSESMETVWRPWSRGRRD